jgi:restriction endonuclease Mrr
MPRSKSVLDEVMSELWKTADALLDRLVDAPDRKHRLESAKAIEDLHKLNWLQFEQLVADAYRRQGFKVVHRGGQGDGGIDLIVTSPAGTRHPVQCKQWRTWKVGGPRMREFVGALQAEPDADWGIYSHAGSTPIRREKWRPGPELSL